MARFMLFTIKAGDPLVANLLSVIHRLKVKSYVKAATAFDKRLNIELTEVARKPRSSFFRVGMNGVKIDLNAGR